MSAYDRFDRNLADQLYRAKEAFRPPPDLTVSGWSDQYMYLSPETAAEAGRWKTIPYQKGILDAFSDPNISTVVCKKSARVGWTKILNNVIGYHIHQDPCSMLVVQPTIEDAQGYSKEELSPMFRDTPALRGSISESKSRDSKNTILKKSYTGGNLHIIGANSPRGFRRITVRVVLFDEVDGYPPTAGTEGDQVRLGIRRSDTFWNRKIGIGSTPTTKGASRIDDWWESSDQRHYYVPCPHCKEMQVLKWGGVDAEHGIKWPDGEPQNAYYQCEHCSEAIDEGWKRWMVERGRWVAHKPESRIAGFHIWAAYSYAANASWGQLASEFIDCKGDPLKLKTFINTILGETFEERGDAPDWEKIYSRREFYQRNIVPKGGLVLVGATDVQKDRLEVEIKSYGRRLESWSVDHRVIYGDPAGDKVWSELDGILDEVFVTEEGFKTKMRMMAVDSGGHHTTYVYNFARKHGVDRVMAIKGRDRSDGVLGKPSTIDYDWKGRKIKKGVHLWHVGVNLVKSEIYSHLRLQKSEDGYPPGYMHFPDYDPEYFKQLTSEYMARRRVGSSYRYVWVLPGGVKNEALDLNVYCRAVAARLHLDYFTDQHWDNIESGLKNSFNEPAKRSKKRKSGTISSGVQV